MKAGFKPYPIPIKDAHKRARNYDHDLGRDGQQTIPIKEDTAKESLTSHKPCPGRKMPHMNQLS